MVSLGHRLIVRKIVPFGALFWCHFPKGHCFPITLVLGEQCPFGRWHQDGASKGTVLQTIKRHPKGAVLVPIIFFSVVKIVSVCKGAYTCVPINITTTPRVINTKKNKSYKDLAWWVGGLAAVWDDTCQLPRP